MPVPHTHVDESRRAPADFRFLRVAHRGAWQIGHAKVRRKGQERIGNLRVERRNELRDLAHGKGICLSVT
jgi:hypothetical protein